MKGRKSKSSMLKWNICPAGGVEVKKYAHVNNIYRQHIKAVALKDAAHNIRQPSKGGGWLK